MKFHYSMFQIRKDGGIIFFLFFWQHLWVSTEYTIEIFLQLRKLQFEAPSYKYQRKKPRQNL